MAYWVVKKKGFKDSALIEKTKRAATIKGERYFPGISFKIVKISKTERDRRMALYRKRLKKKGLI